MAQLRDRGSLLIALQLLCVLVAERHQALEVPDAERIHLFRREVAEVR
jgi:hypothetical protein